MKNISKIGKKATRGILILAVLIGIVCSAVVGLAYRNSVMRHYHDLAFSYADTAADLIDGDRIAGYLETLEEDDYYRSIKNYMYSLCTNSSMQYYYVFVPLENELVYIWDAEDTDGTGLLGEHDSYSEGDEALIANVYSGNLSRKLKVTRTAQYGYIASAFTPIYDSTGTPAALVGVDLMMPGIVREQLTFLALIIISIVAVLAIFGFGFSRFLRKTMVNPLVRLSSTADTMIKSLESSEDLNIDIHTGDEIEDLSHSFETMFHEVRSYIGELEKVTAEKERIGAELNVATRIQAHMLPGKFPAFPDRKEFDIFATMTPAREVGGDFYDFFFIDDDHLAVIMADVCGKGVPAALFMVISKTLLDSNSSMGGTPADILVRVNNKLCQNNDDEMFVTVWLGILEISTGKLIASNAGHEYPAIMFSNDHFELLRDKHGLVIGCMDGSTYQNYELQMKPGDKLFLYTDGIPEAISSDRRFFGTDGMVEALNIDAASGTEDLLRNVASSVSKFVKDAPQSDDMTMLCLEYFGPQL